MIYRIVVCDGNGPGTDIYGPDAEMAVLNPHLEIELNSAGSLEFTLPVENMNWNVPNVFQNEIEVWEDDKIIWFGRPLQIVRDWNNQRRVVCEGALSYFNDSIQRTWEQQPATNKTNISFFRHLINGHNNDVMNNKNFIADNITIESTPAYRKTDYDTTLDCLQNMCLAVDGGYFILRKEYIWDVVRQKDVAQRYIDWYEELPDNAMQDVQFGVNLLDISQDLNGADICTVLIVSGKDDVMLNELGNKNPDNNDGVGHDAGSDEIYYAPGTATYGRIVQQKSWNDYSDINELWRKAKTWLIEKNTDIPTIECSAADLYYIKDPDMVVDGPLQVGMKVQVVSAPHDFNKQLLMYKISMDLDSGVKKVTLGTPPKKELTDIVAPSSGGSSTSGGKGAAGGSSDSGSGSGSGSQTVIAPVQDVKVKWPGETNYSTTVKKKTAKIDLTRLVTDVKQDGISVKNNKGEANIITPVKDVKVNNSSVVDENGIAKLNSDDFGKIDDVKVDGRSVVNNKIAEIEIPVKDVKVNNSSVVNQQGSANISIPVEDVQVDNVTVVDENGIAKLNSDDFGKVDDVRVDGESVVKNKIAELDSSYMVYPDIELIDEIDDETTGYIENTDNDTRGYTLSYNPRLYPKAAYLIICLGREMPVASPFYVRINNTNDPFDYLADRLLPIIEVSDTSTDGIWYDPDTERATGGIAHSQFKVYLFNDVGYNGQSLSRYIHITVNRGVNWWKETSNTAYGMTDVKNYRYRIMVYKITGLISGVCAKMFVHRMISKYRDTQDNSIIWPPAGSNWLPAINRNEIFLHYFGCLGGQNGEITGMMHYDNSTLRPHMKNIHSINDLASYPLYNQKQAALNIDRSTKNTDSRYYPMTGYLGNRGGLDYNYLNGTFAFLELRLYVAGNNEIIPNPDETATDTLYKLKIDEEIYAIPSGSSNVEANPSETATDDLETIRIGNTIYDIPSGGTTVVPNPTDSATADLSKIRISNTIYGVATPTDIQTLQSNFQDGVDTIYDACVAKGSTPASQSLSDVVQGIMNIPQSGGGGDTIEFTSSSQKNNDFVVVSATSTWDATGLSFTSEVST